MTRNARLTTDHLPKTDPVAAATTWLQSQPWHNHVSLDLLRGWLEPDDIHIKNIVVHEGHKRQGFGRQVMRALLLLSERHQVPLTLEADETGLDHDWLQTWYLDFGFEYHRAGCGDYGPYMIRFSMADQSPLDHWP